MTLSSSSTSSTSGGRLESASGTIGSAAGRSAAGAEPLGFRGGIGRWASDRQRDGEGGAAAGAAADADVAAVVAHDPERHPEPQDGALPLALGREERLEDVRDVLLLDPLAGVA